MAGRALISKLPSFSPSSLFAARSAAARSLLLPRASPLHRLRRLLALAEPCRAPIGGASSLRCFSTRPTTSSLNDPSPNWSNRPPKETILLDGCDFEHWLVVMEPPDPNLTRDEIIDSYIKTLAQVVGSEDEARMKIYSVSTKHYFAFGALVSEELSYKIKTLERVRWVLPDSYLDVKNKDYGGEPFIDGKAVPYDPKYHEEWVRNNARANERSRRNDRPRNYDRSRNFERRRENMQNFQNRDAPPPNQDFQNPMPPRDIPPMPSNNAPNVMPPMHDSNIQNAAPPMPNRDFNAMPPNNANSGGPARSYQNQMPNPQNSYVPNNGRSMPTGPGNSQGYQGGNPGSGIPGSPGYQGYQGGPRGYQQGGGPNYQQGVGPSYQQSGGPSYQQPGGGPVYQQGGPTYQPSGPSYQSGGPNYQPSGPSYQSGGQGGGQGSHNYQPSGPSYQSGVQGGGPGSPNYQPSGPSYQSSGQGGGPNYQAVDPGYQSGGGPAFQGRDTPGRD